MKKVLAPLFAVCLFFASIGALAHGHSAHRSAPLCNVRTCTKKSTHKHGKTTYRAHHSSDGHRYHKSGHH